MGILNDLLSEKKAVRRRLLAEAEVLAKQINDLEKEIKAKPVTTKPAVRKTAVTRKKSSK